MPFKLVDNLQGGSPILGHMADKKKKVLDRHAVSR
jgi:hypothetical protein